MQSSSSVDTSRVWNGQMRPADAAQRASRPEPRSSEIAPTAVKEDAFPDVLNQAVTPTGQPGATEASTSVTPPSDGSVSSDSIEKKTILSDTNSESEPGMTAGGTLPAWLTSLLDGLAIPATGLQASLVGSPSDEGSQAVALGAVGMGKGRASLDTLLQRLQSVLEGQESVHPDSRGMLEESLDALQKNLAEETSAGTGLFSQLELPGDSSGEETSLPALITIRHTSGQGRMGVVDGSRLTETVEGPFALDSDPEARVLLKKPASLREGDSVLSNGSGSDLQNLVSGQAVDWRPVTLSADRFSLDAVASLRHTDLTSAVRQAQAAIADMTERMQGEVSLNTESLRAVLRLDPPALGRLNIRLEIDETQRVIAYLHSDNAQTGEFLRQNEGDLRQGFERQGFDSDKVQFVYEEGEAGNFDQWLTEKTVSV